MKLYDDETQKLIEEICVDDQVRKQDRDIVPDTSDGFKNLITRPN